MFFMRIENDRCHHKKVRSPVLGIASSHVGSIFSHREHGGHGGFKHTYSFVDIFFSHRTHRSNRAFLRTVSSPQKASGIQSSQSLSAIIITKKGHNEAYILFIGVSRWLRPFPSGEGKGEGPLSFCPLCVLFFCVFLWEKICHSLFVIMSFCLTKITSFSPSLCYSVFKKTSVSLCHYVILSSKKHLSPSVPLLFCLQDHPFCLSCPHVTLSSKKTSVYLCH